MAECTVIIITGKLSVTTIEYHACCAFSSFFEDAYIPHIAFASRSVNVVYTENMTFSPPDIFYG